jgi:hypothetical protein
MIHAAQPGAAFGNSNAYRRCRLMLLVIKNKLDSLRKNNDTERDSIELPITPVIRFYTAGHQGRK